MKGKDYTYLCHSIFFYVNYVSDPRNILGV